MDKAGIFCTSNTDISLQKVHHAFFTGNHVAHCFRFIREKAFIRTFQLHLTCHITFEFDAGTPLLRQRLPEGCLVRLMNALPTNNIRRVRQAGYSPMMVLTTENAQEAADVRAVMDGEMRELEGTSNHWNRPVE